MKTATQFIPAAMLCFPPAPLNGGPLDSAPEKVGEWVWQPKVDDWRAVLHVETGTLWNQDGKPSSIGHKFASALDAIRIPMLPWAQSTWLDVGLMENRHDRMRGTIIIFDLIAPNGHASYFTRRKALEQFFQILPEDMAAHLQAFGGKIRDHVYLVNHWHNRNRPEDEQVSPAHLWWFLQEQNRLIGYNVDKDGKKHGFYEGLVAKYTSAPYPVCFKPKQATPFWVKHRFDQIPAL